MKIRGGFLALLFSCLLVGCAGGSGQGIKIEDAWARSAVAQASESHEAAQAMSEHGGSNSAVYLVIKNESNQPDRLIRAETDAAHSTELHKSENIDGVMTMRPVDSVDIPAGGAAELKPGGLHIMLVGLTRDLKAGDKLPITLVFDKAGKITVDAEVRAP
jgi:copper(I)-binding protein